MTQALFIPTDARNNRLVIDGQSFRISLTTLNDFQCIIDHVIRYSQKQCGYII